MTADINIAKYTSEELQQAADLLINKFLDALTHDQLKKVATKYISLIAMQASGEAGVDNPDLDNVRKCILVMLNDKEMRELILK